MPASPGTAAAARSGPRPPGQGLGRRGGPAASARRRLLGAAARGTKAPAARAQGKAPQAASPTQTRAAAEDVLARAVSRDENDRPGVAEVADAMAQLLASSNQPVPKALVQGEFELVYSTLLRKLPVVDWGYMPTKETIDWDLEKGEMRLAIETLPFLPTIDVLGRALAYDEATSTLSYRIRDKPASTWRVFYATDALFAADSSKTGLCLVRRAP